MDNVKKFLRWRDLEKDLNKLKLSKKEWNVKEEALKLKDTIWNIKTLMTEKEIIIGINLYN